MAGDVSYFLQWYVILPMILGHVVLPGVVFSFFCRYCGIRSGLGRWLWCGVYVVLSAGLVRTEQVLDFKGSPGLVLETALLACCGKIPGRKGWAETFGVSVVIMSVFSVANGIVSWGNQRLLAPMVFADERLVYPSDGVRELIKVLAVMVLFGMVLRRFGKVVEQGDKRVLGWMTIPVFFIAMVERIIQHSIYGDSLITDSVSGTIVSVIDIDHGEMLFLQIFACFCLFLSLLAHEKILHIFQDGEKLRLLRQQTQAQEIYVREAAMRYKQTRAFRHDIKNHLMVLERLLRDGQGEEAWRYLSQLEETAEGLSCEVNTGNGAVDALLGSKLALARQEDIRVECDIRIPRDGKIKDMDWCIILANGMDNAIRACQDVDKNQRWVKLEGRRKGNFYLIRLENSCVCDREEAPGDGTGLSNVRAVADKYNGRVENEMAEGTYRLRVLLVDSRQEKGD